MTVYAVPQVLAGDILHGPVSAEIGAVVKLVRVLTLGPALMILGRFFSVEGRKARLAVADCALVHSRLLRDGGVQLRRRSARPGRDALPLLAGRAAGGRDGGAGPVGRLARTCAVRRGIAAAGVVSALMLIAISAVVALVVVRAYP